MKRWHVRLALALLLVPILASAQGKGDVNTISRVEAKAGTVEISGDKKPNFTTFTMTDPARLVIDISEAVFAGVPDDTQIGNGSVASIKTASYGSDASAIARVLITFTKDFETDISTSGTKLVVKVLGAGAPMVAQNDKGKARNEAEAQAANQLRAEKEAAKRAEQDRAAQAKAFLENERSASAEADAKRKQQERDAQEAAARVEQERLAQERSAKEASQRAEREKLDQQQRAEREQQQKIEDERKKQAEEEKLAEKKRREEVDQAKREAEAEKRRQAEEQQVAQQRAKDEAVEAKRQAIAEKKRQAEEERQAQQQSRQEAELAKRQAALEEKRRAEEAWAEEKAKRESVEASKRQAAEEKKRLAEEKKLAERQAREDAKAQREAERQAKREAAVKASPVPEEVAPPAAKVEAKVEASASVSSIQVSRRRKTMTFVGFERSASGARVYVKTNEPVRYSVQQAGENTVILELENTRISLRNNRRALDTSFFDTAVARISPVAGRVHGVRVEIKLKEAVAFQAKQEGNRVSVEFSEPARRASSR